MTMQTKRKFTARKWLAAMLCLTIALVALNITTWAIDLNTPNYLTVTTDEKIDEGAKIVIDIYQLAVANPVEGVDTYGYKFNPGFDTMKIGEETSVSALENGTVSLSQDQWEQMAQDASSLIKEGKVNKEQVLQKPSISFGETATLPAGLYLLIARGSELDDYWSTSEEDSKIITIAESDYNKYSFTPALVSLPTKDGGGTAADFGPWRYDATVTYDTTVNMKISIEPRFGKIKIKKTIDQFEDNEEKTFVFQVTAQGDFDEDGTFEYQYSNVASIYFTASTDKTLTAELDHIRAGAEIVNVEEIYPEPNNPNSRYVLNGSSAPEKPWIVSADEEDVLEFSFSNVLNDVPSGGHGILNKFTYDGSNWELNRIDSEHIERR